MAIINTYSSLLHDVPLLWKKISPPLFQITSCSSFKVLKVLFFFSQISIAQIPCVILVSSLIFILNQTLSRKCHQVILVSVTTLPFPVLSLLMSAYLFILGFAYAIQRRKFTDISHLNAFKLLSNATHIYIWVYWEAGL